MRRRGYGGPGAHRLARLHPAQTREFCGIPLPGDLRVGGDLRQGDQRKRSFVQPRVRYVQTTIVDAPDSLEQEIQIDDSGPPVNQTPPPHRLLDVHQGLKHREGI